MVSSLHSPNELMAFGKKTSHEILFLQIHKYHTFSIIYKYRILCCFLNLSKYQSSYLIIVFGRKVMFNDIFLTFEIG